MKFRGLAIATFLLAVLTGVLYWSNHRKPDEDAVKASPDAPIKVLSLDPANVVRFVIHRTDRPEVDIARDGSGAWQMTAPKSMGVDLDAVAGVLTTLSSLSADRLIDDHATDLSQYGLSSPALEVDVATKGNKTQKVLVGGQTPAGGAYYFMIGGDPRLFTFAAYSKASIDKTANDLRDKRLLTANFDNATQIEFIADKPGATQDITFGRGPQSAATREAWQIVKPQPIRTDSDQVDGLIRSLQGASMDLASIDDPGNAAAFNSSAPFATAKITGSFGAQELDIRKPKDKDEYYAKSSALPGIYKMVPANAADLNKSLDDFRKKNVFDFGDADPDKIEIHDGSKAYFLTHSGSDWWGPDGKKLDPVSAYALLTSLRALSASSFPSSGFTTPVIQIVAVSNAGKTTDKVQIANDRGLYVAKRENEAELYGLPSATVTDLQQAEAGLKPATPQK